MRTARMRCEVSSLSSWGCLYRLVNRSLTIHICDRKDEVYTRASAPCSMSSSVLNFQVFWMTSILNDECSHGIPLFKKRILSIKRFSALLVYVLSFRCVLLKRHSRYTRWMHSNPLIRITMSKSWILIDMTCICFQLWRNLCIHNSVENITFNFVPVISSHRRSPVFPFMRQLLEITSIHNLSIQKSQNSMEIAFSSTELYTGEPGFVISLNIFL